MKIVLLLVCLFVLPFAVSATEEVIKSKDLKNQELDSSSSPSSGGENATITPEQAEDLKKQIEKLKENQKKSQEILDELDKE